MHFKSSAPFQITPLFCQFSAKDSYHSLCLFMNAIHCSSRFIFSIPSSFHPHQRDGSFMNGSLYSWLLEVIKSQKEECRLMIKQQDFADAQNKCQHNSLFHSVTLICIFPILMSAEKYPGIICTALMVKLLCESLIRLVSDAVFIF